MGDDKKPKSALKVKAGLARAESLTAEQRTEIGKKAANARWSNQDNDAVKLATMEGVLKIGDVDIDCYMLKDGTRLIHKGGMAKTLGLKSEGGNVFLRTMNSKGLGSFIPEKLRESIENPILFKTIKGDLAHGYSALVLIEICDAIWDAKKQNKLTTSQKIIGLQAEIIVRSCAKLGIVALIDEATGYIKDKRKEEYRDLFREFIRNECKEWEKEFPDQLFDVMYKLYQKPKSDTGKHPQFFGHFIRKYIYAPIANGNGAILDMLDEKNPVVYRNGGRRYKMHQFLTDTVGVQALKAQIWQVVGIGNVSNSKDGFVRLFSKAFPESGTQIDLFSDEF